MAAPSEKMSAFLENSIRNKDLALNQYEKGRSRQEPPFPTENLFAEVVLDQLRQAERLLLVVASAIG